MLSWHVKLQPRPTAATARRAQQTSSSCTWSSNWTAGRGFTSLEWVLSYQSLIQSRDSDQANQAISALSSSTSSSFGFQPISRRPREQASRLKDASLYSTAVFLGIGCAIGLRLFCSVLLLGRRLGSKNPKTRPRKRPRNPKPRPKNIGKPCAEMAVSSVV